MSKEYYVNLYFKEDPFLSNHELIADVYKHPWLKCFSMRYIIYDTKDFDVTGGLFIEKITEIIQEDEGGILERVKECIIENEKSKIRSHNKNKSKEELKQLIKEFNKKQLTIKIDYKETL